MRQVEEPEGEAFFQRNLPAIASSEKIPGPKHRTISEATRKTNGAAAVYLSGSVKME
jgi:hypothetical protein